MSQLIHLFIYHFTKPLSTRPPINRKQLGKCFRGGLILAVLVALVQCGKPRDNILFVAGSDTMVQLSQNMAKEFMAAHPEKKVSVRGGGSGTGVAAMLNESAHIANASRKMKLHEWKRARRRKLEVREFIVGLDGIAIILNKRNPVNQLTLDQLSLIYQGKLTDWSDINPSFNEKIIAISRENNSGTHLYFKEQVLRRGNKKSKTEFAPEVTYAISSQQIIQQIKGNPRAIGYVSMGWVDEQLKAARINDKDGKFYGPDLKNIKSRKYPLARTLQFYGNMKFKKLIDPFADFHYSDRGQAIIKRLGFIPLDKADADALLDPPPI